jgi:membrane protein DedA with SNARE-associated domain
MLWLAIILLTVPIILRAFLDAMNNLNSWEKLVERNEVTITTYNLVFFLFGSYIPIVSQTASLIFGFLRYN